VKVKLKFLLFLLILVKPLFLFGGDVSNSPILRIETGMHTAPIWRVDTDLEGRFLVTASDDKTIRLWQLGTDKLIKIFRPPVGEGNEGKIYSVAISPDGKDIAAGGWVGSWDGYYAIYIYERETGNIKKTIGGLLNVAFHLAYSKDGRYLAAGLGKNNGIRVFSVKDNYREIKTDIDYEDNIYWLEFSYDGRLVVSSYDGNIRLYDQNFNLIKKIEAPGGKQPFQVSFSQDGSKVAVGYGDKPRVDILSGYDLSHLYSPNIEGLVGCDFGRVAISSNQLFAGGTCSRFVNGKWKRFIRKWDRQGKGNFLDISVAEDTIFHLHPLNNGSLVFASGEPSFGIINAAGKILLNKKGEIADFRDMHEKFKLAFDSSIVGFGYETFGGSPAIFDLNTFILENSNISNYSGSMSLMSPILESKHISISDWKHNLFPKLNGKSIKLEQYEMSRCYAISPDEKKFILGASWYLRLLDKEGNEIWKKPAPGTTWAVNISGNGKVAVAAFGDGTIRWYRIEDGKEILAFFPHADRKRWVLWTPKGYYYASPGGEDLIGWHINKGKDKEADFFPASRFRERFYRPDIIAKLFSTYDEEKAITLANEESGRKRVETSVKDILPPVITIISPADGSSISSKELAVRYVIRNPSGEPITGIKVLIDGRPVSTQRGVQLKPKKDVSEWEDAVTITVPERDLELSLITENRFTASVPSTARLYWKGKKEEFVIKPKLYILAIGISKYKDPSLQLQFAHKDAQDFVNAMMAQKGKLYEDVKIKLLTDEHATKDDILDGLEWLQKETTHKDVAMLFIAGHGINDQAGIYYFLPQNADLEKLKRTGVPFSDIKNTVASVAGKVTMFVDTCHSGGVMGKRAVTDITGVINELTSAENGVVVFASSTGRQYSLEDPTWKNGAFTKALVEGVNGRADLLGKGKITVNMLDAYIAERVKELTKGKQTPVTTKPNTVPDFPVAVK